MEGQNLAVIGSIIGVLLTVNAYFIKELVKSINELKIELVRITTKHDDTVLDVSDNKKRILELERAVGSIRERVHSIEGMTPQILAYLKDN